MDYTAQSLSFKLRKVLRYVRLYGPARTRVKVLGQLHMKRRFATLPVPTRAFKESQTVGLIGCGNYAFSNIAYYLNRKRGPVLRACMDINPDRAASLAQQFGVPSHSAAAEDVINDAGVRLVYIASNHASHAEYAIQALDRGKSVYIEKPHVVNHDQLDRLVDAMQRSPGRVFLGFNRPWSRFGRLILDHLGREKGAGMYNWFVVGHVIEPDHWYFNPEEGGRVLGNFCHWTDFVLRMTGGALPVRINPTRVNQGDTDMAVSYVFADGTIAVITFSTKGHTFEGVKEHLSAQRGNCLVDMRDYEGLTIEVADTKVSYTNTFRDHGHSTNILHAYDSVMRDGHYVREQQHRHIIDTAWLFLKTNEAVETNQSINVGPYRRQV